MAGEFVFAGVRVKDMGTVTREVPSGRRERLRVSVIQTQLPCDSCEEKLHSVMVETPVRLMQISAEAHRKDLEGALRALRAHLDGVVK